MKCTRSTDRLAYSGWSTGHQQNLSSPSVVGKHLQLSSRKAQLPPVRCCWLLNVQATCKCISGTAPVRFSLVVSTFWVCFYFRGLPFIRFPWGFHLWACRDYAGKGFSNSRSCFFFFYVPGHARSSVQWVKRSPQSAAVSQPVPKAPCGHPPDRAMSGVSKRRRWGRTAGCGWGVEDLCRMDIRLNAKCSVCGGGRGVDSVQFSV